MAPAVTSTRWCPTPEQLMILEEMYRGGIRTPNASQIQHITTHLSYYGKIEGKNVFYWFQNHKARDRQKLRRKLTKQLQQQQLLPPPPPPPPQQQQQPPPPPPPQQQQQQPLQQPPPPPQLQPQLSLASTSPQQLFPATTFLPQGGYYEDGTRKVMNYTWKVPETSMYGRDWTMMMMMMDVGPYNYYNNNNNNNSNRDSRPPLKTLELFPITATNLKDECCKSTSCTTSTSTI